MNDKGADQTVQINGFCYDSAQAFSLAKNRKCLVSGNPTDPTFLGPTLNFFGTSENFSSIFRVF